jgi:hypothetical protein
VLLKAADGLSKMGAGAERTALAAQLFGKGYKDLLPLLLLGSKGISEQTALAGKLGAQFSGSSLQSAKQFIKGQREMKTTTLGLQVALGTALMPTVTAAMKEVTKFVLQFRDGTGRGGEFKDTLKGIYDTLKPIVAYLVNHPKVVAGAFAAYVAFKASLSGLKLFNTLMTAFGSVSSYAAAGTERGAAFGSGVKGGVGKLGKLGTAGLIVGGMFAVKEYGPAIDKWQQGLSTKIKAKFPGFKHLGKDLIDALGNVPNPGLPSFPLAIKAARAVAKASKGGFVSDGKAILNSLGLGGRQSASKLSDATRTAISNAATAARRGAQGFKPIGRNISSGMAAGINQGIQTLVAAAVKAVNDAKDAAKRASKQNSPSLVFAEIGAGMVEGMALGMSKTAPLVKAAKNMVKKANPGFVSAAGGVAAAGQFGVGSEVGNQQALLKAQALVRSSKGKAKTRAENALTALEARQAAVAARATAKETLKGFVQGILDTIKSTEIDRIMAPVNERRAKQASDQLTVDKASVSAKIKTAEGERDSNGNLLPGSPAALKYARDGARLDAKIAQAKKRGDLDAIDTFEAEKKALDDRFGPEYLKGLKDQLQSLSDDELEASSEKAGTALADKFKVGLNAALDALLNGGTVETFFNQLKAVLGGSGVTAGSLPASVTAGAGDAAALLSGTVGSGAPVAGGIKTWNQRISEFLMTRPKGSHNASDIAKALGTTQANVYAHRSPLPKGHTVVNRASGGYLTPGALTMVGETGPELVMGGKVNSSSRTNRMGSAGMNITINAVGNAANDPVALARELGWQLATR